VSSHAPDLARTTRQLGPVLAPVAIVPGATSEVCHLADSSLIITLQNKIDRNQDR
jgi:hypothetical protein